MKSSSGHLIPLEKKHIRMKEGTEMKTINKLSSSVYEYVCGVYKGSGETLGNIAAHARKFELEMNAFLDRLDVMEESVR